LWEDSRELSATRTATDAGRRDLYILPRWKKTPLDAITHMEAQAWVAELGKKMGPASVTACFHLLKLPLDAATMDGKIRVNPLSGVKLPRPPKAKQTADTVLTADELSAVIVKMRDRWKALVFVPGWLGLRWSEALGLRRCDVNVFRKELQVGRVVVVEPDCRTLLIKDGGKTGNATRTVPLPEPAVKVMLNHMATYCVSGSPEDFPFLTTAGLASRRSWFRRSFMRGLKGAEIPKKIRVQDLRHTAATLMLDAGIDLLDVSKRLGHANPSTTYDIYAHLLDARREAGTAALAAAMRKAVE
jgi:integrase